jgi:hypothetical protein
MFNVLLQQLYACRNCHRNTIDRILSECQSWAGSGDENIEARVVDVALVVQPLFGLVALT